MNFEIDFDRGKYSEFIAESEAMVRFQVISAFIALISGFLVSIFVLDNYGAVDALLVMILSSVAFCYCMLVGMNAVIRRDMAKDSYRTLERIEALSNKIDDLENDSQNEGDSQ